MNEAEAAEFLERLRWGDSPSCPRCASADIYRMLNHAGTERNRDCRWRCRQCYRMFTVRTATPLEETRISLSGWARAMLLASESHKMPASTAIQAACGAGCYKSAVYLQARLATAMPIFGFKPPPFVPHFYDRCLPRCAACGQPAVNTTLSRCPRCRAGTQFRETEIRYAAERGEWTHPSKEETWWKIARTRLMAVNRLLAERRSRRSEESSAPAVTSPDSCPT